MAWRATSAELKDTSSSARKKQLKLRVIDEERHARRRSLARVR